MGRFSPFKMAIEDPFNKQPETKTIRVDFTNDVFDKIRQGGPGSSYFVSLLTLDVMESIFSLLSKEESKNK